MLLKFTECLNILIKCPMSIYKAGENLKLKFNYYGFAKDIIKNSKVDLIIINNERKCIC